MTEELHNLNTDFKELFANNQLDELAGLLNQTPDETVLTITHFNYDIIKGYLDKENYGLLRQYLRFVAFSSYLCEYAGARRLLESDIQLSMTESFHQILEYMQQGK